MTPPGDGVEILRFRSLLRSRKPKRAIALFERALKTAKTLDEKPPLTLLRCIYHAGEAARQAKELSLAHARLEEAADLSSKRRTGGEDGLPQPRFVTLPRRLLDLNRNQ